MVYSFVIIIDSLSFKLSNDLNQIFLVTLFVYLKRVFGFGLQQCQPWRFTAAQYSQTLRTMSLTIW